MPAKYIIVLIVYLGWAVYTTIEVLTKGISAIYLPLGILSILLIPFSGYFSSRISVLFGFSPFQLPIPLAPQISQLGMFLTLPGLLIDQMQGKLRGDKYFFRTPLVMLAAGSFIYFIAMLINFAVVDGSIKGLINNTGGRTYIKHFLFLISPLALLVRRISSKEIYKIVMVGWALAAFYLLLDLALYYAPVALGVMRIFMQTPGDFFNFAGGSVTGEVRLAATGYAGIGLGFLFLAFINDRRSVKMKIVLYFLVLVAFVLTCLAGYRRFLVIIPSAVLFCTFIRGKITFTNILSSLLFSVVLLVALYTFYEKLPASIQRSAYILPGIADNSDVYFRNTKINDNQRDLTSQYAKNIMYQNMTFGVGYFHDYEMMKHTNPVIAKMGVKNGSLGYICHLYNLGYLGLLGSTLIMASGFWMCLYVFRHFMHRRNRNDVFAPLAAIACAYYMYRISYYCLEHGNGPTFFANAYPALFLLIYLMKHISNKKEYDIMVRKNHLLEQQTERVLHEHGMNYRKLK